MQAIAYAGEFEVAYQVPHLVRIVRRVVQLFRRSAHEAVDQFDSTVVDG